MNIELKFKQENGEGHYDVFVDGFFYCSCDIAERETIEREIRKEIKDAA